MGTLAIFFTWHCWEGAILGMGVGPLMPFSKIKSLSEILPSIHKRLTIISLIFFAIFAKIVT
jgi:hypothetical protein